jgi:glutamate synthase (NADPH/NADH) large chain
MTGGMAYLHDPEGMTAPMMNMETLITCPVTISHWEQELKELVTCHADETGSLKAADILLHWDQERHNFVQVCPKEMLVHLPAPLNDARAQSVPAE